jgi:hypothetical protein
MSPRNLLFLSLAILLLVSSSVVAQEDEFGKVDTIYAEPYQIDAKNWAVNVSMFNDEEIIAISIPLTYSAGKTRVVADSAIFKGGVAEEFRVKYARVDTAIQSVTIGLINDIGVSVPPIPPGKGRVATVFLSSLDGKEIESLKVDTTTTPPGNNLQMVKPPTDGIIPAFIVMEGTKLKAAEAEKEGKAEEKAKQEKEG